MAVTVFVVKDTVDKILVHITAVKTDIETAFLVKNNLIFFFILSLISAHDFLCLMSLCQVRAGTNSHVKNKNGKGDRGIISYFLGS